MGKKLLVLLVVLAAMAVVGVLAVRGYAGRRAEEAFFTVGELGAATPADVGLAYDPITFASGDRMLRGWFVRRHDTTRADAGVLVFHGNGTSIAGQVGLVEVLARHGFSSMVFDYSGYGASAGEPSVSNLRQDALAAFGEFSDRMGFTGRKFLLGTSLGAAVLLDVAAEIQGSIDGIVVIGTFGSGVETAVRRGHVPDWLSFLLPDPYDNVEAAALIEKPILVMHSSHDEVFPIQDAQAIVDAARGPAILVRADSSTHETYLSTNRDWEPVLEFLGAQVSNEQ
jgi:alpha-beta hydrolase superfamily lysophospholipase